MAKVTELHHIDKDQNLSIFKQDNSSKYYARFKLERQWYVKATGEADKVAAITKAIRLHTEYSIMISNNMPVHNLRRSKKHAFKTIAEQAIERIEQAIANGTGKPSFATYISVIKQYHIPFFNMMNIREAVQAETLSKLNTHITQQLGRVPFKSTMNTYNTALSRVFDEAVIHQLITPSEVPVLQNNGLSGERRGSFTRYEYEQIVQEAWDQIADSRKLVTFNIRTDLYYYIQLVALTGMRPGTEVEGLTWGDMLMRKIDGEVYNTITIRTGKTSKHTGTREIVCKDKLLDVIADLMAKAEDQNKDTHIFIKTNQFSSNFRNILNKLNLKRDAHGDRTLYSLRHSYITWELQRGTPIAAIAKQAGTSAEMVERHYSHIIAGDFAEQLSGRE